MRRRNIDEKLRDELQVAFQVYETCKKWCCNVESNKHCQAIRTLADEYKKWVKYEDLNHVYETLEELEKVIYDKEIEIKQTEALFELYRADATRELEKRERENQALRKEIKEAEQRATTFKKRVSDLTMAIIPAIEWIGVAGLGFDAIQKVESIRSKIRSAVKQLQDHVH